MTGRYPILTALVLAGLLAAAGVLAYRWEAEAATRTVAIVVDADAWRNLAVREGYPPGELLGALRRRGATAVAVYERTLRRLREGGAVFYLSGDELLAARHGGTLGAPWMALLREGAVRREAVYVRADPPLLGWIEEGFRGILGDARVRRMGQVLEVLGDKADLEEVGLGFLPAEARAYQAHGFDLVLRVRNYRGLSPQGLAWKLRRLEAVGRDHTVVFDLADVLGYDRLIADAAAGLRALGYRYGRIEVFHVARKQRGEDALTAQMQGRVIRLFSVTPEELATLSPGVTVDKFVRAAQERSIRLLYVRPITSTAAGADPIAVNQEYVGSIVEGVGRRGLAPGRPEPLPPLVFPRLLLALAALGGLALGGLVLGELGRVSGLRVREAHLLALVAAGVLVTGALWVSGAFFPLWRKALALGVAVAGATLAVTVSVGRPRAGPPLLAGVLTLWHASTIAAATGVLVAGLLAGWTFMLAADTFLGVKVAHVLPPALAAYVLALEAVPVRDARETARAVWRWLEQPLRLQWAVLAVLAAVVAVILLGRSGNFGLPLPDVEARFRTLLEDALIARPRTKEFLIGHPALLLAGAAGALGIPRAVLPLAVVGAIGQAGLINSFSHIHTPLPFVLLRSVNALLLGTLLGGVALLVLQPLVRRWRRGVETRRTAPTVAPVPDPPFVAPR